MKALTTQSYKAWAVAAPGRFLSSKTWLESSRFETREQAKAFADQWRRHYGSAIESTKIIESRLRPEILANGNINPAYL
jgi:hypothetical protein